MDMYSKYQRMFLNPLFEFPYPQSLPSAKQTYWSQAGQKKEKKKSVTSEAELLVIQMQILIARNH